MKQCPNGHNVGDNVKFCPTCGAEIVDSGAKFCAKCGNERKGTEKFCPKCGTPYGQSSTSNVSDTNIGQDKSSKKGILIASVVAVIALIGGAVWYFLGNQQDKYSLEGLAKAAVNYDIVSDFHEGLALVSKDGKYGFIDKMGNEVIPCIYDFSEEVDLNFHDGLALVYQGGKCFFINKEGKEAFPFNYNYAKPFSDGLAAVGKGDKFGYIDTKGNEVIPLSDKYCSESFHDGLAAVFKDEKYGFINKKGELVIPYTFEDTSEMGDASEFYEGFTIVCKNGKSSYVDKSGKELNIGDYSYILNFSDGMAVVNKDGKYGFIDTSGKEVIPCAYEEATSFSEGYAFVKKDGKYMQIDKSGKILNTFNYERISVFHDGFAGVSKRNGDETLGGYIDKDGKEVIPCIYNIFSDFSEGLAVVEKDGVFGFVDKKGNSTFDLQDEEVNRAVQAKIQEKEEARKEAERRAEEERKRIEEENKPQNKFYELAKSGNFVWVCNNALIDDLWGWSRVRITMYFYPSDKKSGRVSTIVHGDKPNSWSGVLSSTTVYSISDNHISFSYSNQYVGSNNTFVFNFNGIIQKSGGAIILVGKTSYRQSKDENTVFEIANKTESDPLN